MKVLATRVLTVAALVVVALLPIRATAEQNPPPGTVIDSSNLEQYKELFGPAMQWVVKRGVKIRVGEYKPEPPPEPVLVATEKYASQVQLAPDGSHLLNYVAGLPFPNVDTNDPKVAIKLMFNYEAAIEVDDLDLRNFDCDTGALGTNGDPVRVEKHFLIDHFRRMYFTGRLEIDPKPEFTPNRDEVRYKEALYPLLEPFDLKGVGFTYNRYLDHTRQDDSWLYLPQLRRVRRLSSAQRSDALFGQDTDQDSYGGYAGNIAWMDWKFLGEKTVLASWHAEYAPVIWGEPSGDFVHADVWEPRPVWILEGLSKLPQYAYSKRVMYLDRESYIIAYSDMYDQAGELWKMWVNEFKMDKAPIPNAKYIAPYNRRFYPSITMVDMQLDHGTYCALPSHRFPGEQGWYINLGDKEGTTEDFFALSNIIAAGR